MADKIEVPADLAVETCRALIACVEELSALHVIEYGIGDQTQNPRVLAKMEKDDEVRLSALPVLYEFYEHLSTLGLMDVADVSS
jgi:phospholipid N-methyltransferase